MPSTQQSGLPSDQQQTREGVPEIWLQKYAHDEQGDFSLSCQYLALDESAKLVMTHKLKDKKKGEDDED
jgi:hypothetical protein